MKISIEAFKTWIDNKGQEKPVTVQRQHKFWEMFHSLSIKEKQLILEYLNLIKQ